VLLLLPPAFDAATVDAVSASNGGLQLLCDMLLLLLLLLLSLHWLLLLLLLLLHLHPLGQGCPGFRSGVFCFSIQAALYFISHSCLRMRAQHLLLCWLAGWLLLPWVCACADV
jgi:hypothetical protein